MTEKGVLEVAIERGQEAVTENQYQEVEIGDDPVVVIESYDLKAEKEEMTSELNEYFNV